VTASRDDRSRVAVASRSFSRNEELRAELLARYARVTFNDAGLSLAGKPLVDFLRGHDRAIIALETVDDELLAQVPELRVIAKYGVGLDNLDLAALSRRGVKLGWTGGVNSRSVAELTIAFALIALRQLGKANDEVRAGTWRQIVGAELHGRVVGIVGLGQVGRKVAALFQAFGCVLISHDILPMPDYCAAHGIRESTLDQLLAVADVVTIHVPLNRSTRGLIDARRLALTKPGVVLINTARGGIVDDAVVQGMLESGHMAAAAFDVFEPEPPQCADLLRHPNFFATPHIGGSSREAILAMGRAAIDGLRDATDAASFVSGV